MRPTCSYVGRLFLVLISSHVKINVGAYLSLTQTIFNPWGWWGPESYIHAAFKGWGPRSRDGMCSAQWQRAGLNWPRTLTTQGCLWGLVLRNSHCFLQQWSVRGLEGLHRAGHPLSCFATALVEIHVTDHYSEHGMSSEMETQGLTVRLTWNQAPEKFWSCGHLILVGGPRLSGMREREKWVTKLLPCPSCPHPSPRTP